MNYKELLEKEIDQLKNIPVNAISGLVSQIINYRNGGNIITSGMGKAGQIANMFSTINNSEVAVSLPTAYTITNFEMGNIHYK